MTTLGALLRFPLRPGAAARSLARSRVALLAPLLPAGVAAVYLAARGCGGGDAAAAGVALLLILAAAGLGGAIALGAARLFLPDAPALSRVLAPCLACAAWAPVLFLAVFAVATWAGAGATAALAAGLALLVWGVAVGMAILADAGEDAGRGLVASCLGMTGALLGLWLGLAGAPRTLVTALPAPPALDGGLVLVRVEDAPPSGSVVVLLGPGREAVFARTGPTGAALEPLGAEGDRVAALGPLELLGRVFFRFGGPWGGHVVGTRHAGKPAGD